MSSGPTIFQKESSNPEQSTIKNSQFSLMARFLLERVTKCFPQDSFYTEFLRNRVFPFNMDRFDVMIFQCKWVSKILLHVELLLCTQ